MVCKFSFSYKNREIFVDFFICIILFVLKLKTKNLLLLLVIKTILMIKYFSQGINYIF